MATYKKLSELDPVEPAAVATTAILPIINNGSTNKITIADLASVLSGQYSSVYYVSGDGSDETGLVGSTAAPYQTIAGAIAAAIASGQETSSLIYIYPGVYAEQGLYYRGTIYMMPGATLKAPTQASADAVPIFQMSGSDTLNIYGYGDVLIETTTDTDWNSNLFTITESGSIQAEFNKITLESTAGMFTTNEGRLKLTANELIKSEQAYAFGARVNAEVLINIKKTTIAITGTAGSGNNFIQTRNSANLTFNGESVTVTSGNIYYGQQMAAGSIINFNVDRLYASGSGQLLFTSLQGSGQHILNLNGTFDLDGIPLYQGYAASDTGLQLYINGVIDCRNSPFFKSITANASETYTIDSYATVTDSTYGIEHADGNLFLNGSLYMKGTFTAGINRTGTSNLYIDTYKIVNEGAAGSSITGTGTYTVNNILSSNVSVSTVTNAGPGFSISGSVA